MSRGKWKTTVIKNQVAVATMAAEGIRIAGLRAERKEHKKKSFMDSAREHIGLMIDRIDPLEAVALVAGTVIVHQALAGSSEIIQHLAEQATAGLKPFEGIPEALSPLINPLNQMLGLPTVQQGIVMETDPTKIASSPYLWIISLFIAFIMVRYGGEIIKSLGGLLALGNMLIGVV